MPGSAWTLHVNTSRFETAANAEIAEAATYNLPGILLVAVCYCLIHRVACCVRCAKTKGGRKLCMPCRGSHNQNWWITATCVATWLLMGMLVYMYCERANELATNAELSEKRGVWQSFELKVRELASRGILTESELLLSLGSPPAEPTHNWGSGGSWYFSTTIVSTIGYGDFAPVTFAGRTFTMFYALSGIGIFGNAADTSVSFRWRLFLFRKYAANGLSRGTRLPQLR